MIELDVLASAVEGVIHWPSNMNDLWNLARLKRKFALVSSVSADRLRILRVG